MFFFGVGVKVFLFELVGLRVEKGWFFIGEFVVYIMVVERECIVGKIVFNEIFFIVFMEKIYGFEVCIRKE